MRAIQPAILILTIGAFAGACGGGGDYRKTIEGNNTGGVIPPALVAGGNAQALADAHCARWSTRARITFSGVEAGGDTVFVCESAAGPAMMAIPGGSAPMAAPATKQAPAKR